MISEDHFFTHVSDSPVDVFTAQLGRWLQVRNWTSDGKGHLKCAFRRWRRRKVVVSDGVYYVEAGRNLRILEATISSCLTCRKYDLQDREPQFNFPSHDGRHSWELVLVPKEPPSLGKDRTHSYTLKMYSERTILATKAGSQSNGPLCAKDDKCPLRWRLSTTLNHRVKVLLVGFLRQQWSQLQEISTIQQPCKKAGNW